jgi:para-nitrobenzyl esterase
MRLLFASLIAVSAAFCTSAVNAAAPQVKTESGAVAGVEAGGVDAFKGIPFAAPPLGALRWRAPQPAKAWPGVRDASQYRHDCMQTPFGGDAAPLGTAPSEDCLVVNVWRPAGAKAGGGLPVIVWIYGGGFVNGGSSPAVYDGSSFARKGVIMVSFNYRLGRFGFFGHPALTQANADGGLLGNYGYMDQIAAMKWVQRNIAAFGGDPAKVTVFGESAGGASVHMLLTSPLAKGLFRAAIIESGGGRGNLMGERALSQDKPGVPSSETLGLNFAAKNAIVGTGPEALAKLRALPAEIVNDGLGMMTMMNARETYGGPMTDGRIVSEAPSITYLAGRQAQVPVIVGANSADSGRFSAETKAEAFAGFGAQAEAARLAYDPDGTADLKAINTKIGMDRTMVEPARFVAETLSKQGVPAYNYRFSYVADSMASEWKAGTPHATEIPYVMNTVAAKYGDKLTAKDAKIADLTNSYWANFAKTGNPNGEGLPNWPKYNPSIDAIMDFGSNGEPLTGPDPLKARLDVTAAAALQ